MARTAALLASPRARALFVVAVVLAAPAARADSQRIVLGTHDGALASALSVAVSPRGLSVVELADPLARVEDIEVARRELAVPGTVAVIWLCSGASAGPALCFCGPGGGLVVRPITVATPLAPPDAAALALSVKVMLGPPAPPPPAAPPAPAPTPAPTASPPPSVPPPLRPPALALELEAGARVQSPAVQHVGLRVDVGFVFAPAAFDRVLGVGLAVGDGPALAASAPAGRTLNDVSARLFARGRLVAAPAWLELDAGPSLHILSVSSGAGGPGHTEVAIDARAGAVVPAGRALIGVRAGGFYVLSSPDAGTTPAVALPHWNGEVLLTLAFAVR